MLVHLDVAGAWLTAGPRLPQHVVRSLTCDAVLAPVWRQDERWVDFILTG